MPVFNPFVCRQDAGYLIRAEVGCRDRNLTLAAWRKTGSGWRRISKRSSRESGGRISGLVERLWLASQCLADAEAVFALIYRPFPYLVKYYHMMTLMSIYLAGKVTEHNNGGLVGLPDAPAKLLSSHVFRQWRMSSPVTRMRIDYHYRRGSHTRLASDA